MMCECIVEGKVDADIEGKVDVSNDKLVKVLKEQNDLIRHQNTILSGILNEMVLRRVQK